MSSPGRARARELEHAAPELAEHAPEPEQLVLGRERAGHRLARDRAVRDRARGGEAERARGDALLHERRPSARCSSGVAGAFVRAALAHHVGAHGAVRHLRAEVHAERGAASSASRYSGSVSHSHCMPSCSAVPGMSSTPSISWIRKSLLARAHRREADAAVAHHRRGDAVPARRRELRIPGGLAVVVRVDVDEARASRRGRSRRSSRAAAPDTSSHGGDAAVL